MTKPALTTSETDARLVRVLDQYLAEAEAGRAPDKQELLARYPDLADDLEACLASLEFVKAASVKPVVAGAGVAEQPGPEPATGVLGDYRIIREIGRGGMGVVYEAEQISLGRRVALKVLPFAAVLDPKQLNRFRNEAHAAAQLHHTNIVPVFSVGSQHGVHYYAMQFIEGQPLSEVVRELRQLAGFDTARNASSLPMGEVGLKGRITDHRSSSSTVVATISTDRSVTNPAYFRAVANLAAQVAEALEHAHENGVVHRDIKPSNLLLDAKGKIWITDFGLAQCQTDAGLTMTGDLVGTVRYMSPEQALAKRIPVDHRTDVYSLAVTVYELLTLEPAFPGDDRQDLLRQIAFDDPKPPRRINKSVPVELETILLKAMAKNPASRYGTAREMADDLNRFLVDKPIRAKRPNIAERLAKFTRRHRAVMTTAAVSAVLLLIAVAVVASVAAIWLSAERGKTATERDAAIDAKKLATEKLFEAYTSEARARVNSGESGQRHDALKAVREAARIRRSPELGNLAIAALARTDIRLGNQWAGHPDGTDFLVFDADLERYARSDGKGIVSIVRVTDDQEVLSLFVPEFTGRSTIRFSADGKYLAVAHGYGISAQLSLHIWELQRKDKPVLKQPVHHMCFDFTPDSGQVAIAQSDGSIGFYDLATGSLVRSLGKGDEPLALMISSTGRRLAVKTLGSRVQVRDVVTGDLQATVRHPDTELSGWAWHPHDENLLATANWGIYLWDLRNPGKPLAYFPGQAGPTTNIAFSHGGDVLASKGWVDTTVRLWDTWTGRELLQVPGTTAHGGIPIQFSRDDRRLAFYHSGTQIGLWELDISREFRSLASHSRIGSGNYPSLDISPDAWLLAAASRYDTRGDGSMDGIRLWDFATGRELAFLAVGDTYAVRFHPWGGALFSAHPDVGLYQWPIRGEPDSLQLGPPRRLGPAATATHFSISPDGRQLTVAYENLGGIVFDVADSAPPRIDGALGRVPHRQQPSQLDGNVRGNNLVEGPVNQVAISSDGRWFAAAMSDGNGVMVFDARTREHIKTLPARSYSGTEFSPDRSGKWLVTSAADEYCIYEAGTWELRHRLTRTSGGDQSGPFAFSPDGKVLAVVLKGLNVDLIDPTTASVLATLEPGPDRNLPGGLRFSPDGSQLAVCSSELRTLHVWDLRRLGYGLADLGIQWELPAYPPPSQFADTRSLHIGFDLGELEATGYHHRARAARRRSRYDQAIDDYRKVVDLAPTDALARNELAWIYVAGPTEYRDPQAALPLAEQAAKLAPNQWLYLNTLGVVYYRLGRYSKAIEQLTQSVNTDREFEGGSAFDFFFLAMSHHQLGQSDKSRDYYDRAVRWCADQSNLPANWARELNGFRAEAEAVLSQPPSAP